MPGAQQGSAVEREAWNVDRDQPHGRAEVTVGEVVHRVEQCGGDVVTVTVVPVEHQNPVAADLVNECPYEVSIYQDVVPADPAGHRRASCGLR